MHDFVKYCCYIIIIRSRKSALGGKFPADKLGNRARYPAQSIHGNIGFGFRVGEVLSFIESGYPDSLQTGCFGAGYIVLYVISYMNGLGRRCLQ